jgi:hypothetical protein
MVIWGKLVSIFELLKVRFKVQAMKSDARSMEFFSSSFEGAC